MLGSADVVNVVVPLFLALITVLLGLVAYIFKTHRDDTQKAIADFKETTKESFAELKESVDTNTRHSLALANSYTELLWRQDYTDEFLARRYDEYIGGVGMGDQARMRLKQEQTEQPVRRRR